MRVLVLAVGRLAKASEKELVDRYLTRLRGDLARSLGVAEIRMVEIAEARAAQPDLRRRLEADAIRAKLRPDAVTIALDERGTPESSEAFAARLGGYIGENTGTITFVIGGPDGLDESLRGGADAVLGFGPMTFPHQLVRVMLVEQLYRSFTIMAKHPYHRR